MNTLFIITKDEFIILLRKMCLILLEHSLLLTEKFPSSATVAIPQSEKKNNGN